MRTDWEVLGVPPGSTAKVVRRAFRRLAVATHPDRGGDPADFRRVREAYDRIRNRTGGQRPKVNYYPTGWVSDWIIPEDWFPPPGFEETEAWIFQLRTSSPPEAWPIEVNTHHPAGNLPVRYLVFPGQAAVVRILSATYYRRIKVERIHPPDVKNSEWERILDPTNSLYLTFPPQRFAWILGLGVWQWKRPRPLRCGQAERKRALRFIP